MTFTRGIFAFALIMLAVGIIGSRYLAGYLFGDLGGPPAPRLVAATTHHRAVSHPAVTSVHAVHHISPRPASHAPHADAPKPMAHVVRRLTAKPVRVLHPAVPHRALPPRPLSRTPAGGAGQPGIPGVQPAPATGAVSLSRYWVGSLRAQRGNTIEVGYVINNPTGHPARVLLGASLKSSQALGWATSAVNDPAHDVVAVVPPGISTHIRFFTLPSSLHPGRYDVAWGLRNYRTGQREALVVAQSALKATR